jgi:protein-disulfide isomerase
MASQSQLESNVSTLQQSIKILSALVIVLIFGVAFLFYQQFNNPQKAEVAGEQVEAEEQFTVINEYPQIQEVDHFRGNKNSNIVLLSYSDYECPFCKMFDETANKLVKSNNIVYIYRHFPLENLHQNALTEAIAAECVAKLGGDDAFWQFSDLIFENTQSNDGLDLELLPEFAQQSGVAVTEFQICLDNQETEAKIKSGMDEAGKFGVSGTPASFLINKKTKKAIFVPGAQPAEKVVEAIQKIQ